jgi:membrane-associated phospholipid phosphatase
MDFLARYSRFVIQIFSIRFTLIHAVAILGTWFLMTTGVDWLYFVYVLNNFSNELLYLTDVLGFIIPGVIFVVSVFILFLDSEKLRRIYAEAAVYAILLSLSLSTILKAFTGRVSPPHHHHGQELILIDNSHGFNFGFMNQAVIGGWPSSHATVAFALAVVFVLLLSKRWYLSMAVLASATFVGLGVTISFHWLSEFVAGACLGTVIGLVVGRYYLKTLSLI